MLRARHRWNWGQLRRYLAAATGRSVIAAGGVEYFRLESVTVSRYAYRGNKIPAPWPPPEIPHNGRNRGEPVPGDWHGGFGERSGETGRWQHRNRAPGRLNKRGRSGRPAASQRAARPCAGTSYVRCADR